MITAWYNRQPGTVDGFFTLQNNDRQLFTRMPARSGQRGFTDTSWERGKSPIPYGVHTLFLTPSSIGQLPTGAGIGEFYPIGGAINPRVIQGGVAQRRWDIGLHPENAYPGSAGCIVLRWDTPAWRIQVERLFIFLRKLAKTQKTMRLEVL